MSDILMLEKPQFFEVYEDKLSAHVIARRELKTNVLYVATKVIVTDSRKYYKLIDNDNFFDEELFKVYDNLCPN